MAGKAMRRCVRCNQWAPLTKVRDICDSCLAEIEAHYKEPGKSLLQRLYAWLWEHCR